MQQNRRTRNWLFSRWKIVCVSSNQKKKKHETVVAINSPTTRTKEQTLCANVMLNSACLINWWRKNVWRTSLYTRWPIIMAYIVLYRKRRIDIDQKKKTTLLPQRSDARNAIWLWRRQTRRAFYASPASANSEIYTYIRNKCVWYMGRMMMPCCQNNHACMLWHIISRLMARATSFACVAFCGVRVEVGSTSTVTRTHTPPPIGGQGNNKLSTQIDETIVLYI